jgi:peptidoglycan-associated lipoprotein
MTLRIRSLVFLALAAGSLTACRKKPEPAPTPVSPPVQPPPPVTPPTPPPSRPPVDNSAAEAAAAAARAIEAAKASLAQAIYFEYDQSDIRADAQSILDAKVPVLQANPAVRIRIVGHTDERGSDEYNMALGQRRSAAAKRYLEGRGIAAARIDVVSMGEERPAMSGEGEASWSRNRRDEFEIVAGADQIRAPGGR